MNRNNSPTNACNPITVLTVFLVMTCVVLTGLGWLSYHSYCSTQETTQHYLRIEELRGSVVHLDEVLTMSALMAAFSGNPQWEERYRRFEPQLDAAIKESLALAPEAHSGQAATETNAANIKLVEMENHAFDLVRQGRQDEAKAVLIGDEYKSQKQVYTKGMSALAAGLAEAVSTTLKRIQRQSLLQTWAMLLLTPLLIVGWLVVFCAMRTWKSSLAKHAGKLVELNQSLDQKVLKRTQELQKQSEQLNVTNEQLNMQRKALDESLIVAETDARGRITYVNRQFCEISKYSRQELIGQDHRILNSGYHRKSFIKELWRTIRAGRTWRGEIKNRAKDGSFYWVDRTIVPLLNEEGQPEKYLSVRVVITKRKQAEAAREKLQRQLIDSSRQAGMAEMATGALHNVGNVLNSVNVSTQLTIEKVKEPHVANLARAVALMDEHTENLAEFVTSHPQGRHLPSYLRELSTQLTSDRDAVLKNLDSLTANVDHIKEIINLQQDHAKIGGVMSPVDLSTVLEDAIKVNDASLIRHHVELRHEIEPLPPVLTDKHKVLQILVNLISNAKHALNHLDQKDKVITIRIASSGEDHVKVEVEDNGVGIFEEDLAKIFRRGFTTKTEGHGFGLHSAVLAAKELGGTLTVHSDGPRQGARFTLELPANIEEKSNTEEAVPCEA